MDKKNENLQKQEEQAKEVISEIKSEYTKTADFLEEHTNQQIVIKAFAPCGPSRSAPSPLAAMR